MPAGSTSTSSMRTATTPRWMPGRPRKLRCCKPRLCWDRSPLSSSSAPGLASSRWPPRRSVGGWSQLTSRRSCWQRLREKLDQCDTSNVETVDAGFLTYEHTGAAADVVYSRFALHHLPDFWQAIALRRMAEMLRPGGVLRLSDVVYSFEPADAEQCIEAWITDLMAADVDAGWTRAEIAEHVRDENSTFTWLLEPMIARAGFEIIDATYSASRMLAQYLCRRR